MECGRIASLTRSRRCTAD